MPKDQIEPRQDDEIQFLFERSSNALKCEICFESLNNMTAEERQEHYEVHFSGELEVEAPSSGFLKSSLGSKLSKPKSPLKRKRQDDDEKDVFWYPSRATLPPSNFTPGLIPVIKKALMKSHAKGNTHKAYLCHDHTVHIESKWDRGWGCGYRNFEMACIPLMEQQRQPLYFPLLDAPISPGVKGLQMWLEKAWKDGYDPEGAEHFKYSILGSHKWIGTADLYVAFTSRGIPCNLVDFDLENIGPAPLVNWIAKYFAQDPPKQSTINDALRGAAPIIVTDKLPIILQHEGHSRTVIGFERSQHGIVNLLMFDPSKNIRPPQLRQFAVNSYLASAGIILPSTQKRECSPKKLLSRVLHTSKGEAARKDSDGSTPPKEPAGKRPRAAIAADVIVIDDDDVGPEPQCTLAMNSPDEEDLMKLLKLVRVHTSTLKKAKYQILYFPVTEPLDESQRRLRRIVTSMKVN